MGFWRAVERLIVTAMLFVVVIAISVAVLTAPWFTHLLASRLDVGDLSGLSTSEAASSAELVRSFVTSRDATSLPTTVAGRMGFDASSTAHLEDVREVILAARLVGIAAAVAVLLWLVVAYRRRRLAEIAAALRWGGYACLVAPVIVVTVGLVDFDALFTAFHGLFFAEGTWVFPADSLLIELFPEEFWITAGASLAILVVLQGALLCAAGRVVGKRAHEHEQEANNPMNDKGTKTSTL